MIVLDASAAVELVLSTAAGAGVAQRLTGQRIHAPAHLDLQVASAVRRAVLRDLITDHEGLTAIDDFQSLAVRRWSLPLLLDRSYALRATHSVADSFYLALAEGLSAPLISADARLHRSHGHEASVELISGDTPSAG